MERCCSRCYACLLLRYHFHKLGVQSSNSKFAWPLALGVLDPLRSLFSILLFRDLIARGDPRRIPGFKPLLNLVSTLSQLLSSPNPTHVAWSRDFARCYCCLHYSDMDSPWPHCGRIQAVHGTASHRLFVICFFLRCSYYSTTFPLVFINFCRFSSVLIHYHRIFSDLHWFSLRRNIT